MKEQYVVSRMTFIRAIYLSLIIINTKNKIRPVDMNSFDMVMTSIIIIIVLGKASEYSFKEINYIFCM